MKLIILLSLIGVAGLFSLVASLSKDRVNLYPAGAILLLTGFFLISGSNIEIQSGKSFDYKEVNNKTVKANQTIQYSQVSYPVGGVELSELFGLLLIMISLYFFLIPTSEMRLRTLFNRRS